MKKQRKMKKENQSSETILNVSLKKRVLSSPGKRASDNPNTLLIQNTIKGPPGRSRSPGMGKDSARHPLKQTN